MKKILLTIVVSFGALTSMNGQTITPEAKARAAELVSQMTLDEKLEYIGGLDSWWIRAIPRLGIPAVRMVDGPQGVRNNTRSTLYPCGIATAATWSRDLAHLYGTSIGTDARERGAQILLGPGVNIYRSPLCGRNYEYYGEDPYLASETALNYIQGVQEQGIIPVIKHFCGNNQEWSRHHASSDIDERTLHEIYLPAFRKAVVEGKIGAVMSSYGLLNSVHTTENRYLAVDVLREMWGFEGIFMSDWTATYSTSGAVTNGLDPEMGTADLMTPERIRPLLETGVVTEDMIDLKCRHILQTLIANGLMDKELAPVTVPAQNEACAAAALEIAREAVVLLENEDNILPFSKKVRNVVVLGPNAATVPTGSGSGFVTPHEATSIAQGLKEIKSKFKVRALAAEVGKDMTGSFFTADGQPGLTCRLYPAKNFEGEPVHTFTATAIDHCAEGILPASASATWEGVYKASKDAKLQFNMTANTSYRLIFDGKQMINDWSPWAEKETVDAYNVEAGKEYSVRIEYDGDIANASFRMYYGTAEPSLDSSVISGADVVVYCAGLNSVIEGEDRDRPFDLPKYQIDEINHIASLNENLVVVVNAGGAVNFVPVSDKAKAVLMGWYTGQGCGTAIAEILTGKVNPSGRLPISVEARPEDNPTFNSYYANVPGPYKSPYKRVNYDEGVFMGYRGYDRLGTDPLFPFGFGLSYTTFEYSGLEISKLKDGKVCVSFSVKNTGPREGKEVAQLYVGAVDPRVPRPVRELKGYEKVSLKPGESAEVRIVLDSDAFAYYDLNRHDFTVDSGSYTISVGASARDIKLTETITY